jgi:universal stress protein E
MKRFSNILLVADAGLDESAAFERALAIAISNQATLTLIDIVDDLSGEMQSMVTNVTPEQLNEYAVSEKREQLGKMVSAATTKGIDINVKVLIGKPFLEIIGQVLRHNYDLVLKSVAPSKKLRTGIFGSTDMHLIRKCPCPVWMIKRPDHDRYRSIVAAVDRDPEDTKRDSLNRPILEMATSLALAESSELHIVHAWEFHAESFLRSPRSKHTEDEVDKMVAEEESQRKLWLEQLVEDYSVAVGKEALDFVKPTLHLIKGRARQVVPEKVQELDVDLIIMGTVARVGVPGFFMGNTSESILNQIDCSTLTIKPPGFESPITL